MFSSLQKCRGYLENNFHKFLFRKEFHDERDNMNAYVVFKNKEDAVKSLKRFHQILFLWVNTLTYPEKWSFESQNSKEPLQKTLIDPYVTDPLKSLP